MFVGHSIEYLKVFITRHAPSIDDRCGTEVKTAEIRVTDNRIKHSVAVRLRKSVATFMCIARTRVPLYSRVLASVSRTELNEVPRQTVD